MAKRVGLDGHGLALGKAGFLNWEIIKQDAGDSDVVDGRMDENPCGGARRALGGGSGYLDGTDAAGSAVGEGCIPDAGAGYAVGGDIQDGGVAGGKSKGGGNVISSGVLRGCGEVERGADLYGGIGGGSEGDPCRDWGLSRGRMSAATETAP